MTNQPMYTIQQPSPWDWKDPIAGSLAAMLLAGVAFTCLKLLGVLAWSWWAVTAPIWAIPAVVLSIMVLTILYCSVAISQERH